MLLQSAKLQFAKHSALSNLLRHRTFFSILKHNTSSVSSGSTASSKLSPQPIHISSNEKMATLELATFGSGCFWSKELLFQRQNGVMQTKVGYSGGSIPNPTYEQVCDGETNHAEVVQLHFDPRQITYAQLLEFFWSNHDPTTLNQQGNDIGTQYRSVIFYHNDSQLSTAKQSKKDTQNRHKQRIVTQILPFSAFYPAEDYHQRYLEKRGQSAAKGDTTCIRCYG